MTSAPNPSPIKPKPLPPSHSSICKAHPVSPTSQSRTREGVRMAPPPTPSTSWVILSRRARARAPDDDGADTDFSLPLPAPPRVTVLTLHPRVSPLVPSPAARRNYPCVVATDPSGLILITTPPDSTAPYCPVRAHLVGNEPPQGYFVCDVASATAIPVPDPDELIFNNNLGVIAAPGGGGHFMVAEFQYVIGCVEATLLCFSSRTGEWIVKSVRNPLPHWLWTFYDVVSHGGKLWWVDRAVGLLSFDPFADEPEMGYVPLPEGNANHGRGCRCCSGRALSNRRCVHLSDGKFRCVEMIMAADSAHPKVSMRTLADPRTATWTLEYEVSLDEIWGCVGKASGFPKEAPELGVIHPKNPDVVYFLLEKVISIGVDLPARNIVGRADHKLVQWQCGVSSSSVLPFELPPSHGIPRASPDNAATEESTPTASPTKSVSNRACV